MSKLINNCREWSEKVKKMSEEEKEKELEECRNTDEGKIAIEYCDKTSANDTIEYRTLLKMDLLNFLDNFNAPYKDQIQDILLNTVDTLFSLCLSILDGTGMPDDTKAIILRCIHLRYIHERRMVEDLENEHGKEALELMKEKINKEPN